MSVFKKKLDILLINNVAGKVVKTHTTITHQITNFFQQNFTSCSNTRFNFLLKALSINFDCGQKYMTLENAYRFKSKKFKSSPVVLSSLVMFFVISNAAHAEISDIDLNTFIMTAVKTHPLVESAIAEQKATQEGISASKRNMLPAPSINSGYQKGNDIVTQINVRQPLWSGGKLTANVNQAIFDDKAAVEFVFEQQNQVAKNTIDAWQTYISAIAMQRVYEKSLKQLDEFESMMNRRVGQGVSAKIELDLLTNRILQQQSANQASKEQERIAVARLEQMLGKKIAAGSSFSVPPLDTLTQEAKNLSEKYKSMVFDDASFRSATVVKEYYQIESAKQSLEADKAANYPTVYAQYSHNHNHEDNKGDGQFSIGLNYEPGSGFSNMALTRASQSRVESLVKSQEASRRNIIENLQIQYQQFSGAKDKELSLLAASAGNQIVVDSYRRQFIAGRKSWLEVLNAIREQTDNKIELVTTRSEMLSSFHKLQVDLGEMPWQEFQSNRKPQPLFKPIDYIGSWKSSQKNISKSSSFTPSKIKNTPNYMKTVPKSLEKLIKD